MEDKTTPIGVLLESVQAYTKTSLKLLKYKATGKIAEIVSNIAVSIIIYAIIALFLINLNIGLALLLGYLLGKTWLGFVLLSGLYAFAAFVIYLFRDKLIKRPLSNSIITQLLKDENLNEDHLPD